LIFLDGVFDFSIVFSIGSEPLHQMANAHGTATEQMVMKTMRQMPVEKEFQEKILCN
jgi:hypothetical protein